jgi:hypothetical protein
VRSTFGICKCVLLEFNVCLISFLRTYFHNSSDVSKVERVIGGQPNMFCFSKVCLMPIIQVFKRPHTFIINDAYLYDQ